MIKGQAELLALLSISVFLHQCIPCPWFQPNQLLASAAKDCVCIHIPILAIARPCIRRHASFSRSSTATRKRPHNTRVCTVCRRRRTLCLTARCIYSISRYALFVDDLDNSISVCIPLPPDN
ncbi:hypothetical protein CALVIDRAFT_285975 [Calocera viscosa TUFC12733]|uniref:Secreted protein n=1 Tax=Calocera viscosa (strain TUFC12733) TaxID=1330018 RepID=A0A167IUX6_CALVF|nr:hypothetical protein CALVIDRAFT_285975 [Calocera viscosa TUFC12733]